MKILISPAKSLDFKSEIETFSCSQPKFLKQAELKLGLNKSCYVNLENDFTHKLSSLIKKDYKKNKIYYNY